MSKAFGMAGLRLGLRHRRPDTGRRAAGGAAVRTTCRRSRRRSRGSPWHTWTPCSATVARLRASRDDLVAWLRAQGFEVPDSDANFVLVGSFADRHAVWAGLLEHGVLVREVGPPQWLRVTVGTDDEMDRFRDALRRSPRLGEAGT